MADGTRHQSLVDLTKQMDDLRTQAAEQTLATTAIRDELGEKMSSLEAMLTSLLAKTTVTSPTPNDSTAETETPDPPDPNSPKPITPVRNHNEQHRNSLLPNGMVTRLTKLEFPKFDGTMLREWIYRCEQFFLLDSTPPELKVRLASLHLEGKALQWHHNFINSRYEVYPSWPEYIVALSARFAELVDDPLSELVSLKQGSDSVDLFLDKFECALTRLSLPIAHALSIFLTNLHPHLALHARQFNVTTVTDAARIAKLHEASLQQTPTKPRAPFTPYQKSASTTFHKPPQNTPLLTSPDHTKPNTIPLKSAIPYKPNDRPPRKFSYDEMQERRRNGMCMFCDEPFSPGHHLKHKRSQIYVMECEEDELSPGDEDFTAEAAETTENALSIDQSKISVNALDGSTTFNCMRVVGQVAKTRIHILIDPGSSHNFLDLAMAKELGCNLETVRPLSVAAANGNNMISSYKCAKFAWKLQGYSFHTELRTLPLDCCDLVLGVQWLTTLGPIWWDFSNLKMEFTLHGTKHTLRGVTKSGCKLIKGSSLNKLLVQGPQIALLYVQEVLPDSPPLEPTALLSHIATSGADLSTDPALQRLLSDFSDLFAEPTGLPPFRQGFNHKIPVDSDSNPDRHPICFISRALGPRHQSLSVYEKELLAVVHAVQTWSSYLTHRPFVIRTDQKSLKYLLEQKVSTPFQHMWLSKLMGYTYAIEYKEGKENYAADALSRVSGAQLLHITLTQADQNFYDSLQALWQSDAACAKIISDIQSSPTAHPSYTYCNGELRRKGKLVVGNDEGVKTHIFKWLHDSALGGHSGRDATARRITSLFYWPRMNAEIQNYVRHCSVCQRSKYDQAAKPGTLQPLSVPEGVWQSISLDFIEGLPPSFNKHCILVIVDRLSKNAHFLALSHPYTAIDIAQTFLDQVFRLHGMPQNITSDRDPTFLSEVWKEMFRVHGVDLRFSTSYHPQTDGQTEITNKTLETYLRCMTADNPASWSKWLPLAEWWYNTNFHTAIQCSPYEILYGQPPPLHLPYLPGESASVAVDRSLQKREEMISVLKFHLLRAQNRMRQAADSHRSIREFKLGDFVYLKLQPYRQHSLKSRLPHKLSPRYYGPFKVIDKVGNVAYKLELPPSAAIHNVFHVSQLKLCPNPPSSTPSLPQYLLDVGTAREPEAILERKMVKRQNAAATKVLVQWKGTDPSQATWEFYQDFVAKFPNFHP
ncbi:hypothetical protein V2J09_021021 [Rumex salicifolius]